jgi:hypothetical protein
MKTIVAVLLFALAASLSGQQAQTSNPITPGESEKAFHFTRKAKDSEGCMYLDGGGNALFTYWGNVCHTAKQFTIQWYGNLPPEISHIERTILLTFVR